jgi:hypothetical protein
MTEAKKKKFWDSIVQSSQIRSDLLKRKNPDIYESVLPELRERYESEGWMDFRPRIQNKS